MNEWHRMPMLWCVLALTSVQAWTTEPDWWRDRPDAPGFMQGFGLGSDFDQARLRATADLVASLVVSVRSQRTLEVNELTKQGTTTLDEQFRQRLVTTSGMTDLPSVQVQHQAQDGANHYVHVTIPVATLVTILESRLAALKPHRIPPPQPPTWAWVATARREMAIAKQRDTIQAILLAQGQRVSAVGESTTVIASDLGILADGNIAVNPTAGTDAGLTQLAITACGRVGWSVQADSSTALTVSAVTTPSTTDRGWHRCRIEATVAVIAEGRTLAQIIATGDGTSTSDPAAAERMARGRLATNLDDHFSADLLPALLTHHPE